VISAKEARREYPAYPQAHHFPAILFLLRLLNGHEAANLKVKASLTCRRTFLSFSVLNISSVLSSIKSLSGGGDGLLAIHPMLWSISASVSPTRVEGCAI
jgi:hypothetical protein